jgi:hypothetical protein
MSTREVNVSQSARLKFHLTGGGVTTEGTRLSITMGKWSLQCRSSRTVHESFMAREEEHMERSKVEKERDLKLE